MMFAFCTAAWLCDCVVLIPQLASSTLLLSAGVVPVLTQQRDVALAQPSVAANSCSCVSCGDTNRTCHHLSASCRAVQARSSALVSYCLYLHALYGNSTAECLPIISTASSRHAHSHSQTHATFQSAHIRQVASAWLDKRSASRIAGGSAPQITCACRRSEAAVSHDSGMAGKLSQYMHGMCNKKHDTQYLP
jgi:hypothetical protein